MFENGITKARDDFDRSNLIRLFPDLASADEHFLALRPYLQHRPDSFFDRAAYDYFLSWLKTRDDHQRQDLQSFLGPANSELSQAFVFLRETNADPWYDVLPSSMDDYGLIRFIDKTIHPTYLRLVEGVLTPLARVMAHFSRLDRRKGTDRLDAHAVIDELTRSDAGFLADQCRSVLRNGIAHGGITYLFAEIQYRDDRGNVETYPSRDILQLTDDLLDTCNGLAAALKVFLIAFRKAGYTLPLELLLDELREETRNPWWDIDGCVPQEAPSAKQLLLYCYPNSRDFLKVQWSILQSGVLAEALAPGYDRYFFSLHSPLIAAGWAAFDGNQLRDLRLSGNTDVAQYWSCLDNGLINYRPRLAMPRLLGRVDTLVKSLRMHWPLLGEQIRSSKGLPRIVCRDANGHRNSWGCVLRGHVVVDDLSYSTAQQLIWAHRRRIVRCASRHARKTTSRFSANRYLPLGYVQLSVFRRDYRRRQLSSFGLRRDLVCTVRLQRVRRIKSPDIMGSTIEAHGRWRIAWNRAWLEAAGLADDRRPPSS